MQDEASALIASGLRGLGEKRLAALQRELLVELCKLAIGGCDSDAQKSVMVSALIKYKRTATCKEAARVVVEEAQSRGATTPPRAPPCPAGGLLVPRYQLRVVAFNSLKLRVEREGLGCDWAAMGKLMSTYDIIVMSEVPADLKRAEKMLARLNAWDSHFMMLASEASGASGASGAENEVHVMYVRAGLHVIGRHTHHRMDGVAMDYAPFSLLLADPTLEKGPLVCVTSLHMPPASPESRRRERDAQIHRLLKSYAGEVRVNLGVSFTDKGAADAKCGACVHVLAGDFNAALGTSEYGARDHGFDVLFGYGTKTTSGQRSFDNFALSLNTRNHFEISASVLQLARPQNSRKSEIGLSDHHPIALTLESAASAPGHALSSLAEKTTLSKSSTLDRE